MGNRVSIRLTLATGEFLAMSAGAVKKDEEPLRQSAAVQLIQRAVTAGWNLPQLAALEWAISPWGVRQATLRNISTILFAVSNGKWVLVPAKKHAPPRMAASDESLAEQVKSAKLVKTWVEMVVVDEKGRPMAGQAYLCMVPDGTVHEGKLSASGCVRFDGIDPGNCAFSLTTLAPEGWRRA